MGWRGGGGGSRESFFRWLRVRLMSKLSVLLLIIGVSKQKITVFIDVGWALFCTACTIVYVKCYHPLVNKFLVICLLLCYTILFDTVWRYSGGGGGVWKFLYLHNRVFSPFHHDVNKLYNQISDVFWNFIYTRLVEVDLEVNLFRSFQLRDVFCFENTAF